MLQTDRPAVPALPYGAAPRKKGLLGFFQPDPPLPVRVSDPEQIAAGFRRGQIKVLIWATLGYALFYFVRKNLSIAMPVMGKELGLQKQDMGLFLTLHGVLYGISKFGNGFLGDRANARTFMAAGLILSALTNVFFGLTSAVVVFGILWMLNGWFQGMGFPPCARLLTHWFPPKELATKMSIWNTSHSIGAGVVVVLCGGLIAVHARYPILGAGNSWRLCFLVPAALAIVCAIVMLFTLPDTPASVGLPDVAGTTLADDLRPTDDVTDDVQSAAAFRAFIRRHVFGNPYIWLIAIANFFVYTVRYAIFDWGPTALHEAKGMAIPTAAWLMFAFEISGIAGMLVCGWVTDRYFGGRGARTCVLSMVGCVGAALLLWWFPGKSVAAYTVILCLAGFFIYGPQALVGIAVANLATKRAAATAVGLTGIFGYASTVLSGWGFGVLVQRAGWDWGFFAILATAIAGTLMFVIAWPAKAHGYSNPTTSATPS
jgi:OPA family glycerol-3-phosphate transporter-like MFS transporter/OPA family sugar phosphate sensor protein UhpC-like MFS transporter